MIFKRDIPAQSFSKCLLATKENRLLLIASAVILTIQFVWFKSLYPFPNLFPDSYEYIASAMENRIIDYRPIGYPKFLQLVKLLSSSHVLLVTVQYILLVLSLLYLLFTTKYILQPGNWVFRILLLCCILNPMIPHVSNFVSSDPLFTALSLIWFAQLLWILVRPRLGLLLLHGIVLFLGFLVRYNALYYPFISVLVIISSQAFIRAKLISIGFTIILLYSFVSFNRYQFQKHTGVAQFAPFSGWQIVANALMAYYYVPNDEPTSVPAKFMALHAMVNRYKDSLRRTPHYAVIETAPYYMWGNQSPVLKHIGAKLNNLQHPEFKKWAAIAPFYSEYAIYLIKQHLGAYIKYYLIDNLKSYNKPWIEYLGTYNQGSKILNSGAVKWFELKTNTIRNESKEITSIQAVANVNGIINILLLLGFSGFIWFGGLKRSNTHSKRIICWMAAIWICNLVFNVIASPIALRYLTFQTIITLLLEVLVFAFIASAYKELYEQEKAIQGKASC